MLNTNVPFLVTKLQPPRRVRGVIARPRLHPLLVEGRGRLLTLVKAPPGSGKTTLALGWTDELAASGARVAWLSIDPEDDDPERFPLYVGAALHKACPSIWNVSQDLSNPLLRSVDYLSATLVNDIAALSDEIFLFLDDYHLITSERIHQQVSLLLRHAPENFHLVVLGRGEPPLQLAALRARGEVLDIDSSALRFDVEETAQLVRKAGYADLPADDLWALSSVTEGWVAALRVVMLSLREQRDTSTYLRRLSGLSKPISGLFAELLDHLPAELTEFMLRISVVERISGTLAEALTERFDGQAMLDRIERQQLFLGVLDQDGLWFAFHPLFREYLQRRLHGLLGAEIVTLHNRAANWYATRELWADAVKHALAAGDSAQALTWINQCAMPLVECGDVFTLMAWERQLHAYVLQSPCRLRLALAWGLGLGMAIEEAGKLLAGVEADIEPEKGEEAEAIRVECRALRAMMIAFSDDSETAGQLAAECLLGGQLDGWVRNVLTTIVAAGHLDACRWQSLYAMPPLRREPNEPGRYLIASAYYMTILAAAEFANGHLDRAADYLLEAMQAGTSAHDGVSMMSALIVGRLSLVRYEQNRLDEAFKAYSAHWDAITLVGSVDCVIGAYRVAITQARTTGDIQRMRGILSEAERLFAARHWHRAEVAMLVERVRLSVEDGRIAEAAGCMERLEALAALTAVRPGYGKGAIVCHVALAKAWVRMGEGRDRAAIEALEPQLAILASRGNMVELVRLNTTLALAHLRQGDEDGARRVFAEACRLAAQSGAVRPIIDQPMSAAPLLALVNGHLPAEMLPLLSKLQRALVRVEVELKESASPAGEMLSPREHHILKLLADGNSNKEIARALGIAPETVKSHLKHVYAKLKVDNRAQAAARAQSLLSSA